MASPLLSLSQITKAFGAVHALSDISFDLRPNEVHALLGENGAGKSTLIRIIAGAHSPDSGTIQINGETVSRLSPSLGRQHGIACIYQQPALFADLSVAENIALRLDSGPPFSRVRWKKNYLRAVQILERIGANISADAEVSSLSMPEQQLVEIACALGREGRIVIMDEPTASLTQKEQHLLFAAVRELRASGAGVIYISHRLEEIFALADRVTVLRDGCSIATRNVDGIDESSLIKLMVGRDLSQIYPPAQTLPGKVILSLKNLGCAASGVHDVNLEVRSGEVVGLAGLVGAGRTELARTIFGITPADSGAIFLEGRSITVHSPKQAIEFGIAYVPEDRRKQGVILEMPIAANITMAVHSKVFPFGWLRSTAERELASSYIRNLDIRTPDSATPGAFLSGGNQQKVSLARWLATKPRLLILDEPTQGVDVGAKSEIHKLIRNLVREGIGVLMISSDLPEVLGMSDRIAIMREGTITKLLPGGSTSHEVMRAALGKSLKS